MTSGLAKCPFCQLPVFGLRGQDMVLDSFYLKKEDTQIIENGIFGDCHVKCLAESNYAATWRDRILGNHISTRNLKIIDESENRVILHNENMNDTEIIYSNALAVSVSREQLDAHYSNSPGSIDLPTAHQVNFAVEPGKAKLDELLRSVKRGSKLSLLDLLSELGIKDKLLSANSLQDGIFQIDQVRSRTESTTMYISGTANYRVSIGLEEASVINSMV